MVPGKFEDVETAAEVGGVGEGLELAERGGGGVSFLREEPAAGLAGEPAALRGECHGLATEPDRDFRDGGEIDVGGDVDFAGRGERVFRGAVFGKGAECAGFAVGVVIFGPGETVVGPEEQAGGKAADEGFEDVPEVRADFGAVVFREGISQRGERV